MSFVVLDTDVASASFLGRLPGGLQARLARSTPCITFVTLGELTKWTTVRNWGPLATFDTRDSADFAQHDGLVLEDVS